MLQWKIYHFSSDFQTSKCKLKLVSRRSCCDRRDQIFFFFWAAARCWSRGKILGVVMLFVQILQWKLYHFWRDFRDFLWKKKLGCKGTLRAVVGSSEVCPWYRNLVLKVICHNFRATNGPNPTPAQRVWDFSLGKFGACVRLHGHWFLGWLRTKIGYDFAALLLFRGHRRAPVCSNSTPSWIPAASFFIFCMEDSVVSGRGHQGGSEYAIISGIDNEFVDL